MKNHILTQILISPPPPCSLDHHTWVCRLPIRMIHVDVERLRVGLLNLRHIGAGKLVGAVHRVGSPVGPVDLMFEHGDGKRVEQRLVTL